MKREVPDRPCLTDLLVSSMWKRGRCGKKMGEDNGRPAVPSGKWKLSIIETNVADMVPELITRGCHDGDCGQSAKLD